MAEKRVKVGLEFEHIPAVKTGRGWLGLEKGKTATVRFDKTKGKLELTLKKAENGNRVRVYFPVEEYAKANEAARKANKIGEQAGASFGTLRKEEETALKRWRAYVLECQKAGTPARNLDDILREAIKREETKDETPLFKDIIFEFVEEKERLGVAKIQQREIVKGKLKRLASVLGETPLAQFSPTLLESAILQVAKSRSGGAIPPKSLKEWLSVGKEIFKWWYVRENDRRAREHLPALHNPLTLVKFPKIRKEGTPAIITRQQAAALLCEVYFHAPEILPVLALQLFCGIRRDEALRIQWKDFKESEIFIPANKAKTDGERSIPVQANLRAWLDAFRALGNATPENELLFPFKPLPANFGNESPAVREMLLHKNDELRAKAYERRLRQALKNTGIVWERNFCRHTAVSFLCKRFGFSNAADWCGHSIRTQAKFYRAAVSEQDAQDYFGIMPPVSDGKAIAFSRSRAKNTARSASEVQAEREAVQGVSAAESPAASA